MRRFLYCILGLALLAACSKGDEPTVADFAWVRFSVDGNSGASLNGIGPLPRIEIQYNAPVDSLSAVSAVQFYSGGKRISFDLSLQQNDSTIILRPSAPLPFLTSHDILVDNSLKDKQGRSLLSACQIRFMTEVDSADKFPRISDDSLLTLVQRQTFRYFWDFGHPVSGLARERNTSGDLVTSGGSGFGVMAIIIGAERGFISRHQARQRIQKMTHFLLHKADRFHGAFSHWLNGATGKAIPFSPKDDGGDLVETSYLMAGLLCASTYFDSPEPDESLLRRQIDTLWRNVEWNWYTQGQNVLYWHWSPVHQWAMNHRIQGWNEALITYILAASSPTYPINRSVYDTGWARNGGQKNGRRYNEVTLPLGPDYGGPLFFAHYTFLGIDPRYLTDQYASYMEQLTAHSQINHAHCVKNPGRFLGYSADCWGLTASDNPWGYDAHSPTLDKGVISPTAALSSLPFTPGESMRALRYFYYILGDRLFHEYGFVDAFSLTHSWFADSFLAIDQGPILIMMENYRSGLIWKYTMQHPDIRQGLTKLGFTYK